MKRVSILTALAAASMSVAAASPNATSQAVLPSEVKQEKGREKEMRRAVSRGTLRKYPRSRGPQAKPKRKANRLHVSKRVRRKHRRAA